MSKLGRRKSTGRRTSGDIECPLGVLEGTGIARSAKLGRPCGPRAGGFQTLAPQPPGGRREGSVDEVADDGVGEEPALPGEHQAVLFEYAELAAYDVLGAGRVHQVERESVAQADLQQHPLQVP